MSSHITSHKYMLISLHDNIDYAVRLCNDSKYPEVTVGILRVFHERAISALGEDLGISIDRKLIDNSYSDREQLAHYVQDLLKIKAKLPEVEDAQS